MMLCRIYRSRRREEMYLYVAADRGLDPVPPALLAQFGDPEPVMTLALDGDRRLARADVNEVMAAIAGQGYYLQMPPGPAQWQSRERADG